MTKRLTKKTLAAAAAEIKAAAELAAAAADTAAAAQLAAAAALEPEISAAQLDAEDSDAASDQITPKNDSSLVAQLKAFEELQNDDAMLKGKGIKQRTATVALCKTLGIDLKGTLKEKIQMYCKAMIEQDTETLKKIYLPVLFSPLEMSSLWQMLKGWINKASTQTKAKWQEICKMQGGKDGDKTSAKMAVLNLAMVKKADWEECMMEVGFKMLDEDEKKAKGTWLYKGELERTVGKLTTARWLKIGKLEEGTDADGEAVYRKVVVSDSKKKKTRIGGKREEDQYTAGQ